MTCENDDTFEVRLWFLPESDVLVYVWSVDQRYDSLYLTIAESMDVTEYKQRIREEEERRNRDRDRDNDRDQDQGDNQDDD